jgi:hypothetical protein
MNAEVGTSLPVTRHESGNFCALLVTDASISGLNSVALIAVSIRSFKGWPLSLECPNRLWLQ